MSSIVTMEDVISAPLCAIIYAHQKFGKTTDIMKAYQNGFFLLTSMEGPRAFALEIQQKPDAGYVFPKCVEIKEFTPDRQLNDVELQTREWVETVARQIQKAPGTISAIVLDEMSTLLKCIDNYLKAFNPKIGYKSFQQCYQFVRWLIKTVKSLGVDLILIHHEMAPKFVGDDDGVENKGRCIRTGGPAAPTFNLSVELGDLADVIIRGYSEIDKNGKQHRYYSTQPSAFWRAGVRTAPGMLEAVEDIGLKALLAKAGLRTGNL